MKETVYAQLCVSSQTRYCGWGAHMQLKNQFVLQTIPQISDISGTLELSIDDPDMAAFFAKAMEENRRIAVVLSLCPEEELGDEQPPSPR